MLCPIVDDRCRRRKRISGAPKPALGAAAPPATRRGCYHCRGPTRDRCGVSEGDEDFFSMANLFPADTGLPMVVWVSERGHARHDVRIKVDQAHGTAIAAAAVTHRRSPALRA
jgi:hypothetical protein